MTKSNMTVVKKNFTTKDKIKSEIRKEFDKQIEYANGYLMEDLPKHIVSCFKTFIQDQIDKAYSEGYKQGVKDEYIGIKKLSINQKENNYGSYS